MLGRGHWASPIPNPLWRLWPLAHLAFVTQSGRGPQYISCKSTPMVSVFLSCDFIFPASRRLWSVCSYLVIFLNCFGTVGLDDKSLCCGPTVQTEMSLATAGIYCTICQRLSGATEDCSIVQGPQLRTLCRQRCCMSASLCMFGSLWNAVAAHEHRRQDGSRRPGTVVKCQTATGVRVWPP